MNQSRRRRAVLTIDDGPTDITTQIVDFLRSKEIQAVLFFPGDKMERRHKLFRWYGAEGLDRDRDIYWTFDYKDYKIYSPEHEFELADVWTRMAEALQPGLSNEILLFHDNEVTAEKYPRYYEELIHRTESMGVEFTQPSYH